MSTAARRAGRAAGRRARGDTAAPDDPYAAELEWPALRRAILAKGGIGPSRDYDRDRYPGDLYREHGLPPDVMAQELTLGRSDVPPWGPDASDVEMFRYLERAHKENEQHPERRYSIADPELAAKRARLREHREANLRGQFGAGAGRELARRSAAQKAHHEAMSAFVRAAIARRKAEPRRPAVGFYTDRNDKVHPITLARRAGAAYAARRGR